jgi:uncharacterized membrane protein YedE/YeeE
MHTPNAPKPVMNPYLAGILLGLVLLLSFLTLGAGLGASGGVARLAAWLEALAWPEHVRESAYFGAYFPAPLSYYLVFMCAGILVGGFFSALAAERIRPGVERGAAAGVALRLGLALAGGLLVGFASRLGQGCTSGQALSGGALMLPGSLLFCLCLFAGGYLVAPLVRRQWHD